MDHVKNAQIKIIDFNHSRMFKLDDSPYLIRRRYCELRTDVTEDEVWQEMSDLGSPQIWLPSPSGTSEGSHQRLSMSKRMPPSVNNGTAPDPRMNTGPGRRFWMFSPRVGTPIYRAPEIVQRTQMYSESIDLWSAGCCIYFMLVG